MCAGNEPVWVGDDEGGASGWMPVSLPGHGRSALLGQAKGGNGARRNDAGDIETGLGTGTDQVTSVDAEGQVDREREAAWLKKTQARSGKHAHDTTGLGSSEEHGVAGGGERHISNLQLDVANTLRALLRGRRLVGRGQMSGSSPDDADTMLELIDGAPEGHEVEVVEEATDKITGYDMHGTVPFLRYQVLRLQRHLCLCLQRLLYVRYRYSLDMMLTGTSLVVEVDGPSHYARGTRIPLGQCLPLPPTCRLVRRLLEVPCRPLIGAGEAGYCILL